MRANHSFIFFIHHIWGERVLWGAVFIMQTSYKMQYFTIFQEKLHSFNTQDHRSMRGLLISENFHVQNNLYGHPVLTFDKHQICQEILKELRFNVIKNLLSLFFINGFITMCNLCKSVWYAWHFEYSCKRCLWTPENKRQSDENYTFETTNNQ